MCVDFGPNLEDGRQSRSWLLLNDPIPREGRKVSVYVDHHLFCCFVCFLRLRTGPDTGHRFAVFPSLIHLAPRRPAPAAPAGVRLFEICMKLRIYPSPLLPLAAQPTPSLASSSFAQLEFVAHDSLVPPTLLSTAKCSGPSPFLTPSQLPC